MTVHKFKRRSRHGALPILSTTSLVTAAALLIALFLSQGEHVAYGTPAAEIQTQEIPISTALCRGSTDLPVLLSSGSPATSITQDFHVGEHNWDPGHRGIDIQAPTLSTIVAPSNGAISFAGSVGGKNSVSMKLAGGVVLSFEPASTTLAVGTIVSKGQSIATVTGHSDHCDGICVHWGARRNGKYVDPRTTLTPVHLVLKHSQ